MHVRSEAQEEMQRAMNIKTASRAEDEEQKRRIQEASEKTHIQTRQRRRSMNLEAEIMAGAKALQEKSSWRAPKTPNSHAANHLRQRKLSMAGFPSLGSMPSAPTGETKETTSTTSTTTAVAAVPPSNTTTLATTPSATTDTGPATSTPDTHSLTSADMKSFKTFRRQATSSKNAGHFSKGADQCTSAWDVLAKVPGKYHEQRGKICKLQASYSKNK